MISDPMRARGSDLPASPARRQSVRFASETASCAELSGRLKPKASTADAIVFAVYMPAQEPGPGIAVDSTSLSSASETLPAAWPPTASKMETRSRCFGPGWIVPP